MRGAEQRRVGDAGQRVATVPVFEQRVAEDVLANADDGEVFDLGAGREGGGAFAEDGEQRVGQTDAELPSAIERILQAGELRKGEGSGTGRVRDFG